MQSRFRQQTRSWKRRRRTGRTEPTRRHRDQQRAGQQPPGQTSSLSVWLCCKPRRGEGRWRKATKAGGSVRESSGSISVIADRWLRSLVFSVRLFASRDAALCFIEASFLLNLYLNTSLTQTELRQVMWGEGGAVMPPPCPELQLRSGSFSFFWFTKKICGFNTIDDVTMPP